MDIILIKHIQTTVKSYLCDVEPDEELERDWKGRVGQESGREVAFGIFLSSNSIQYFPVVKFIIAIFPSLAKIHCFPALKRFPTYTEPAKFLKHVVKVFPVTLLKYVEIYEHNTHFFLDVQASLAPFAGQSVGRSIRKSHFFTSWIPQSQHRNTTTLKA